MSKPLDILALEPFYGGARRAMLEAVVRYSRHRWTLLKLPPRRIERRLAVAANWFSEQLSRHWVGRIDLVFTSEAMNLAALLRLVPGLASHPSVVYFHDDQLPDPAADGQVQLAANGSAGPTANSANSANSDAANGGMNGGAQPPALVNLSTAMSATEIWFNSAYHQQSFTAKASALVGRYPELSNRSPIAEMAAKSRLMLPPVDWSLVDQLRAAGSIQRNPKTVFFETRDANMEILNEALGLLRRWNVDFNAITVGPVNALDPAVPRHTVSEYDTAGQVRGMLEAAAVASAKTTAASDYQAIRALIAGCRPVLPDSGVYPELLPRDLHVAALYYVDGEGLAELLEAAVSPSGRPWQFDGFRELFQPFDAATRVRAFDDRLEQLVAERPAGGGKGLRPKAIRG